MHHLRRECGDRPVRGDVRPIVIRASKVVGRPIFFSLAIMLISFLPVFALSGMEGKMFRPLGFTKSFALVAVVIIGVTIRLTIMQRAREIAVMRVVGATNWFIRGPFLLEGALKGFLGGALALALAYASYVAFRGVGPMAGLVFFKPLQMLLLLVFGVLLGLVGSLVSVGRHLREV